MPMQGQLIQPNLILPLFGLKRILSDSEIANIFTTPVTIVPVVPGHMIMPVFAHMFRPAGTAWTAGSFTGLLGTANNLVLLSSFDARILTSAPPFAGWFRNGTTGGIASLQFSSVSITSDYFEFPLVIKGAGGNPSAGSGGLEVTVFYYLVPMRFGGIG